MKQSLLLFTALAVVVAAKVDIRQPPLIEEPNREKTTYFSENDRVTQFCRATGTPNPSYEWVYTDMEGTPKSITSLEGVLFNAGTGNLTIEKLTEDNEGNYRCKASNSFRIGNNVIIATSRSPVVTFMVARVTAFTKKDLTSKTVEEFQYTQLECDNAGEAFGTTTFSWYIGSEINQVTQDDRVYIDQSGTLHFIYVKESDRTIREDYYKCGRANLLDGLIRLGNSKKLVVKESTSTFIKPTFQYSNSPVRAEVGSDAVLECVFSGYDNGKTPEIEWQFKSGDTITESAKYHLPPDKDNKQLVVRNLVESDEDTFRCIGRLGSDSLEHMVRLDVTSRPIFREGKGLTNIVVVEGQDADFHCDARSASDEQEPEPPIWYINGREHGPEFNPNKYVVSPDKKSLTIARAMKDTDILCVQCSVRNHVGILEGDGCLTVIKPIVIETRPKLRQVIEKGKQDVDLTVTFSADDLIINDIGLSWIFNNQTYKDPTAPPYVTFDPKTFLAYINTSQLNDDQYDQIGGTYIRNISHRYHSKMVEIEVILKERPVPVVASSAGIDPWLIGLIIAIILLIIIIIIIIFVICRKQQEGDYNVDKKETGAGLDPEKELKDSGFNELSRPEYDDFDYPEKPPPAGDMEYDDLGTDNESMGDGYAEEDQHFNEDGSFIGIYNKKGGQQQQPTESTI